MRRQRRFNEHKAIQSDRVAGLKPDHPACTEGRSLFQKAVVRPEDSPRLLVSGESNRKLGRMVVKGAWAGMPIYQLSLEERRTCPRSCPHWQDCYGNAMPFARRHSTDNLEEVLEEELALLNDAHPDGFVVRLHVLGDFYSVDYVRHWQLFLMMFPALRVFGYTAHGPFSDIGFEIFRMRGPRWVVRFSGSETGVVDTPGEAEGVSGILCPAQTGQTECCATCALCWAAPENRILFLKHGMVRRRSAKEKVTADV